MNMIFSVYFSAISFESISPNEEFFPPTRAHAHYIVTEYGVAFLFGKNMCERAKALINIAHPDHREMLERAAFNRFKQYRLNKDDEIPAVSL
jgi:acyl-CoA hydrolase